jgi:hypothetical protein
MLWEIDDFVRFKRTTIASALQTRTIKGFKIVSDNVCFFGIFGYNLYIYTMDLLRIEILNPKASQLLDDLADLKLISIKREKSTDFYKFLSKLRSKAKAKITLDEITNEVEAVRKNRYAEKSSKNRN